MPDTKSNDRRILASCESGPAELRPVLHLPNPAHAGARSSCGSTGGVTMRGLAGSPHTLLLLVLACAWKQDEGAVETQRGLPQARGARWALLSNPSNPKPVSETTVGAVRARDQEQIKRQDQRAIDSLSPSRGTAGPRFPI